MPKKDMRTLDGDATDVELHYCGRWKGKGVSHVFCACHGTEGLLWTSRLAGFTKHKTHFPLTQNYTSNCTNPSGSFLFKFIM